MKKRKMAALALSFAMLCTVAMTGCDSSKDTADDTTAAATEASEVEETTEASQE